MRRSQSRRRTSPWGDPLERRALLTALPKTDLHVHLDGSLRRVAGPFDVACGEVSLSEPARGFGETELIAELFGDLLRLLQVVESFLPVTQTGVRGAEIREDERDAVAIAGFFRHFVRLEKERERAAVVFLILRHRTEVV